MAVYNSYGLEPFRTTKKQQRSQVTQHMPCGVMLKAVPDKADATMWRMQMWYNQRMLRAFPIAITPRNCNAMWSLINKLVDATPGVELKQ